MNPQAIINEVHRENAGIPPKIESINNNMQRLDKYINDADQNWDDSKKQEFFNSCIEEIHQSYNTQMNAMKNVDELFRNGENSIFSMV